MAVLPFKVQGCKVRTRATARLWCAEHGGEISSFEKLKVRLNDLGEWNRFFERETKDMRKVAKSVALTLSFAGFAIPVASWLAPTLAVRLGAMGLLGKALSGAVIKELSGAALRHASLAAIGRVIGGGMKVGTVVLAAAGTALGGKVGGAIAYAYFGQVKDYRIKTLREGGPADLVFINGFLQQDNEDFDEWICGTSRYFPNLRAYGVIWESGRRFRLGRFLSSGRTVLTAARTIAATAISKALSVATVLDRIAANPWHVALRRANEVGVMNAEMLARYDGQPVALMGHSLGARTIFVTLQNLAEKPGTHAVEDVFLFGGAVGRDGRNDAEQWRKAASVVSGTIWNFYSHNDQILRKLLHVGNPWFGEAIGSGPIECGASNIKNVDCTDIVVRHGDYKAKLGELLSRALG